MQSQQVNLELLKQVNIAISLDDAIESKRIEIVLRMYNRLVADIWTISSIIDADVIIVANTSLANRAIENLGTIKTTILYGNAKTNHPWRITPEGGSKECMNVLGEIYTFLSNKQKLPILKATNDINSLFEFFNALNNQPIQRVEFGNDIQFFIDTKISKITFLKPLGLSYDNYISILSSADFKMANIITDGLMNEKTEACFDSFIFFWDLLHQMEINLEGDNHDQKIYQLKFWPPITQIKHETHDLIISALLSRDFYDIYTISGKAKCSLTNVYQYLLPCLSQGILNTKEDSSTHQSFEPKQKMKANSILSKLFSKLQKIKDEF